MVAEQPRTATQAGGSVPERTAVVVTWTVAGDLRFLSHHDERRWVARALVRAGWPLVYSRGFNPQPRLSLPAPRSVGTAADAQCAWLLLSRPVEPRVLYDALRPQWPAASRLERVVSPTLRRVPQPRQACFEVPLDAADAAKSAAAARGLLERDRLVIERDCGPDRPRRRLDIRPYIDNLEVDGRRLRLMLSYHQQRTARPSEILTELGLAADAYQHRVRRTGVQWDCEPTGPAYGPAADERN